AEGAKGAGYKGASLGEKAQSMVGLPEISKRESEGNVAGAAGYALPQAIMLALGLKGGVNKLRSMGGAKALEKTTALGQGFKVDRVALDAAKTVSKEVSTKLDTKIAGIESKMTTQSIDTQKLSADVAYAQKVIGQIERAPAAKPMDVAAAKDVVGRMNTAI